MEAQLQKLISVVSTLIALQVVTLAAVVGVAWYSHTDLKRYVATLGNTGQPSVPAPVKNWAAFVRDHNAVQGREDSPVVVVEYSDFQCPFCKKYSDETRRQIVAKYGDRVRMVFKHYPLERIHPHAMTAAIAAQCAQREGKFWEVHDQFFSRPDALDAQAVTDLGRSLGLSEGYAACIVNEETRSEVEQDIQDASDVGVRGTPTFMINGQFLVGSQSASAFEAIFEQAGLVID